ncbi:MAG: hypothetical protein JSV68_04860 [Anaerolineaceae bacterium]|nr:MAG: hypothetical protein JSV68_04860 [Anaerolineaceae bacterium]
MDRQKKKPGALYYGLGAIILLTGCLVATAILIFGARGLPAAITEAYDLNRLTQIVVPGSADLALSRTGAYAVYYEHRSVIDGVEYVSGETPPPLDCALTMQATRKELPLVPDFVETNEYSTKDRRREGKLIMSTTVNEPGNYTFSCRHPDGSDQPKYVLAFGQNLFWELLRAIAGTAGSILGSLAIMFVAGFAAVAISIVVAIKRQNGS